MLRPGLRAACPGAGLVGRSVRRRLRPTRKTGWCSTFHTLGCPFSSATKPAARVCAWRRSAPNRPSTRSVSSQARTTFEPAMVRWLLHAHAETSATTAARTGLNTVSLDSFGSRHRVRRQCPEPPLEPVCAQSVAPVERRVGTPLNWRIPFERFASGVSTTKYTGFAIPQ